MQFLVNCLSIREFRIQIHDDWIRDLLGPSLSKEIFDRLIGTSSHDFSYGRSPTVDPDQKR